MEQLGCWHVILKQKGTVLENEWNDIPDKVERELDTWDFATQLSSSSIIRKLKLKLRETTV